LQNFSAYHCHISHQGDTSVLLSLLFKASNKTVEKVLEFLVTEFSLYMVHSLELVTKETQIFVPSAIFPLVCCCLPTSASSALLLQKKKKVYEPSREKKPFPELPNVTFCFAQRILRVRKGIILSKEFEA
jgi:hypothetical protein